MLESRVMDFVDVKEIVCRQIVSVSSCSCQANGRTVFSDAVEDLPVWVDLDVPRTVMR